MDELSSWVWQGLQLLSSAQGLVNLVFKIYKTPQCLALKFTVKRCCQTRVGIRIGVLKIFLIQCVCTYTCIYIHTEAREQLVGVSSALSRGSQGWNSLRLCLAANAIEPF